MSQVRLLAVLLACALLLTIAGCGDDDCTTCPDDSLAPTMANIWPHEDGTAWAYTTTYSEYPGPATPPTDTSLPSMAALHADLQVPVTGAPTSTIAGTMGVAFDGMVTTRSGVSAQQVVVTFDSTAPATHGDSSVSTSGQRGDFLRLVAQARPDLRGDILERLKITDAKLLPIPHPYFIGGYAFAYEDSGYYGYGDSHQRHTWKYLEKALAVNSNFSMQLVPEISEDLMLYGRIWSRGSLVVDGKIYRNVIECMYVVDLGESIGTDENGEATVTTRSYFYGTTHFAPGVGPIRSRERRRVMGDSVLQDPQSIITDYRFALTGAKP